MDEYIARFGPDPRVLKHKALALSKVGRAEESVEVGIDVLRAIPEIYHGAVVFQHANDEQLGRIARLIRGMPDSHEVAGSVARHLGLAQSWKSAVRLLDETGFKELNSAEALRLRAQAAMGAEDWESAAALYKETIRRERPEKSRSDLGRWARAMQRLGRERELLRTSPDPVASFKTIALGVDTVSVRVDHARFAEFREELERLPVPALSLIHI